MAGDASTACPENATKRLGSLFGVECVPCCEITLASGGVAALLSGSVLGFAIGLFLIGNAFLLFGALVWP